MMTPEMLDQLEEQVQFCRGLFGLESGQLQQVDVAADLAQPHQGCQDFHAAAVEASLGDHAGDAAA